MMISLENQNPLLSISPDRVASVQECLTKNLESSLLFYYNSFGRKMKQTKVPELYTVEVGIPCGKHVCFISPQEVLRSDKWICDKGEEHNTKNLQHWFFHKSKKTKCELKCKGLNENEMKTEPSDKHLVRLGCQIGITSFQFFFEKLGMDRKEWENIQYTYTGHSTEGIMAIALDKWRTRTENPTLEDLHWALKETNLESHIICQVLREGTESFEIADLKLREIPSDEHLRKLSNCIRNQPLHLGIELGLTFPEVVASVYKFPKDLPGLVEDILMKWKSKAKLKTTHSLIMALKRVGAGGVEFLQGISDCSYAN